MAKGKDTKSKTSGFIYIFTNPAFPEYVKIGYATDWKKRCKELSRPTQVPYSFSAYAVYKVDQPLADKDLHKLIDKLNPDLRTIEKNVDGKDRVREFFVMSAEEAFSLLECIAKISGTTKRLKKIKKERQVTTDQKEANEIRETAMRGPFRFSVCKIPVGSEIIYTADESVRPVVVDDRHIEYNEKTYTMSALVKELKPNSYSYTLGPYWFTYKGERLTDRRDRIEAEKE